MFLPFLTCAWLDSIRTSGQVAAFTVVKGCDVALATVRRKWLNCSRRDVPHCVLKQD